MAVGQDIRKATRNIIYMLIDSSVLGRQPVVVVVTTPVTQPPDELAANKKAVAACCFW